MQIFDEKEKRIDKVKEGIQLIFSHFEGRQQLFPRKMATSFSDGRQFTVYSPEQILNECRKANFIDCRINAYPILDDNIIPIQAPTIIFIDLDMRQDLPYEEALNQLDKTKNKSLKKIKEKLEGHIPTLLWTGNGYHIYIALETRPMELIKELKELSSEPSKKFLKFGDCFFSNNKSDPKHNSSFDSLLLRIPFTFNSKCVKQCKDPEVNIVQRFNSLKIPQVNTPLIREFRLYLADKDLKNKRDSVKRQNKINSQQFVSQTVGSSYQWIDTLLETPLIDHRKYCLWKIFLPYILNVKKLTDNETIMILTKWLNACNDLKKLDFEPSKKIIQNIRFAKNYLPISKSKLKDENIEVYNSAMFE